MQARNHHIFFFEPRSEGHHTSWLNFICSDLIQAGYTLSLGIHKEHNRIDDFILKNAKLIFLPQGTAWAKLTSSFKASQADEAFLNSFDEIASSAFRRASFGLYPSSHFQGRLSGIYHRPRTLEPKPNDALSSHSLKRFPDSNIFKRKPQSSFNDILKMRGFRQLDKQLWLKNLFLLDEKILSHVDHLGLNTHFFFIPDVWDGHFVHTREEARKRLKLPLDRVLFLQYGVGDRRKGLSLVLKAFEDLKTAQKDIPLFLLCAGKQTHPQDLARLEKLEQSGCAKLWNHFISNEQESLLFCASDFILIPYLSHFGSSNILSRASGCHRPVIASDFHLVGDRVSKNNLGLLFKNEDIESLKSTLYQASQCSSDCISKWEAHLKEYAKTCSREAFRQAILQAYPPR